MGTVMWFLRTGGATEITSTNSKARELLATLAQSTQECEECWRLSTFRRERRKRACKTPRYLENKNKDRQQSDKPVLLISYEPNDVHKHGASK